MYFLLTLHFENVRRLRVCHDVFKLCNVRDLSLKSSWLLLKEISILTPMNKVRTLVYSWHFTRMLDSIVSSVSLP